MEHTLCFSLQGHLVLTGTGPWEMFPPSFPALFPSPKHCCSPILGSPMAFLTFSAPTVGNSGPWPRSDQVSQLTFCPGLF